MCRIYLFFFPGRLKALYAVFFCKLSTLGIFRCLLFVIWFFFLVGFVHVLLVLCSCAY